MTDHPNFGRDKRRTSESLEVIGSRKPAMASAASETKSNSDSDNHSCCYATEVTTSEERLFREMVSVEYESEDDQFEERRSRDEEGSRDEVDQMKGNQLQKTQLSLVDDETSAFLSHSPVDSDG